ncbi:AAA family ATPase [Streptomyces sp. NPDC007983]|uniref:helix-turn-helix transcriptional regulator n=1 Tax=Streptomyces sp. NPDC007983 TaxID=3364800 RepID=UPI0036E4D964
MHTARTPDHPSQQEIRPTERHHLLTVLDTLNSGKAGVVNLVGDPGTGKTHLLSQLARRARTLGFAVEHGQSAEFTRGTWGHPFRHVLGDDCARISADAPGLSAESALDDWCRRAYEALCVRAGDGLVLLLDDFHWADRPSQRLVEDFLQLLPDAPILLAVACRPRQTSPRLRNSLVQASQLGLVHRIELGPLTLAESAAMLGLPAIDEHVQELYASSEGNPLRLAFAHSEMERAPSAAERHNLPVPEEFATPLYGEFAGLEPPLSTVLHAAAVLGDRFDVDLLAEVARLERATVCHSVSDLVQRDLLRRVDHSPDHTFRHPLLCRLVYEAVPPCPRTYAHSRAFAALSGRGAPASILAPHIEHSAGNPGLAERRALLRAAEECLADSPERAAHWLRVALRASAPCDRSEAERQELGGLLVRVLGAQRSLHGHRDLLRAAFDCAPPEPGPARTGMVVFCALAEAFLGSREYSRTTIDRALADLPPRHLPRASAALLLQGEITALLYESTPQVQCITLALQTAREHGERLVQAGALAVLAYTESLADDAVLALRYAEHSAAILATLPDNVVCAHPEYMAVLSWAENFLGQFERANQHCQRGLGLLSSHGRTFLLPTFQLGIAYAGSHSGRVRAARAAARAARNALTGTDPLHLTGLAGALESWTTQVSGEESASTVAPPAVPTPTLNDLPAGSRGGVALTALTLARTAREQGDLLRAESLILVAGSGPDLLGIPTALRPACYEVLAASAVAADNAIAPRWAWRARVAAQKLKTPVPFAYATMAQAHVLRKRPREAARLYQRAACLFASTGMLVAQAWALQETAVHLTADGEYEEANSLFALAEELTHQSGCRPLTTAPQAHPASLAEVRKESRRRATSVLDLLAMLTRREREVASIAGTGMRTREIAEELRMSPRTVDVHLTRIYRKLNIRSRAALARVMTEAGVVGPSTTWDA